MRWGDRPMVKLGNLGERIFDEFLRGKGIIPYSPLADGAHPFDRLCAASNKKRIFIAEVKTKPARLRYPDTGIDLRHYHGYREVSEKYNMIVFLAFVDSDKKKIYGNCLHELERRRSVVHQGRTIVYPLITREIIYFPLEAMREISDLHEGAVKELSELSQRNKRYLKSL